MLNSELIAFAKSKADHKDPYDYIADVLDDPDRYYKSQFDADDKTRLLAQYQKHVNSNKFLTQLFDEFRQVNPLDSQVNEANELPELEDYQSQPESYGSDSEASESDSSVEHPAAMSSLFSQLNMNGLFANKSSGQDMTLQALRYQLEKLTLQNNLKETDPKLQEAHQLVKEFQDA